MPARRSPQSLHPQPGAHPGAAVDDLRDRPTPTRPTRPASARRNPSDGTRHRRSGRTLLAILALSALAPGAAAAAPQHDGGDDASHDAAGEHAAARPSVTLDARNDGLTGPTEIAGGFVDLTITTEKNEIGHSVYIARIADGSTMADVAAAGQEALTTLLTFVGGVGTVHDGATVGFTLDLEPGNYIAFDNVFLPEPTGILPFVVGEASSDEYEAPEAEGTVQIGPGMLIAPPAGFDGGGTWRFFNGDDTLTHEALIVRLPDGVGVPELVAWGDEGRPEPAPFESEFAGAGPIGPGAEQWITLPELEPGNYALLCYVPFEDGLPHLSDGMIAPFTVSEATESAS